MGVQRARNENEIEARKEDILNAAAELFMSCDYEDITLATISQKTSISRPSMYNYYKTKEEIFLELMQKEYLFWKDELEGLFARKLKKETFCIRMASSLLKRPLLIKLFSLRQFHLESKCGEEKMREFNRAIEPFFQTFTDILKKQFPDTSDDKLNMFKIQFTLYSYSIYPITQMTEQIMNGEEVVSFFGKIPDTKTIYYNGLLLLTNGLE